MKKKIYSSPTFVVHVIENECSIAAVSIKPDSSTKFTQEWEVEDVDFGKISWETPGESSN